MTEDGRFDDETRESEVIIRLPRGSDPAPELVLRAPPMDPVAVSADPDTPDPGHNSRFGPLNAAKSKQFMYEMPNLPTPGHRRPPLSAGTQPVTDQFINKMLTLKTPGQGRSPPRTGTQPVYDHSIPAQADLVNIVEQLQFEIDALKFAPPGLSKLATRAPPVQPRPKFSECCPLGAGDTKNQTDRVGQGAD